MNAETYRGYKIKTARQGTKIVATATKGTTTLIARGRIEFPTLRNVMKQIDELENPQPN